MSRLTRMPLLTPRPAVVFLRSTLKQVGDRRRRSGSKKDRLVSSGLRVRKEQLSAHKMSGKCFKMLAQVDLLH